MLAPKSPPPPSLDMRAVADAYGLRRPTGPATVAAHVFTPARIDAWLAAAGAP